jgi:HSP20 family protein
LAEADWIDVSDDFEEACRIAARSAWVAQHQSPGSSVCSPEETAVTMADSCDSTEWLSKILAEADWIDVSDDFEEACRIAARSAWVAQHQSPDSSVCSPEETLVDRAKKAYESVACRAFQMFLSEGQVSGHDVEHWLRAEAELLQPVHVNIMESSDALTVQANFPGFDVSDLRVCIGARRLIISGTRQSREQGGEGTTIDQQWPSSEIFRLITLPAEVNVSKAVATLSNRVLEVKVPKVVGVCPAQAETKDTTSHPKEAARAAGRSW